MQSKPEAKKKMNSRYESAKNSPAPSFQRALSKSGRIFTDKIKWEIGNIFYFVFQLTKSEFLTIDII